MEQTKLQLAIEFATTKHQGQFRKNSAAAPYITHPIEVMDILIECGITDEDVLCAAVLHDTVEDTDATSDEIATLFGENVRSIVAECTDDKSQPKIIRKNMQIYHAFHSMTRDGKLVKLADKLSNIRSIATDPPTSWSADIQRGYIQWGLAVCMGLFGINKALDDSMKKVFNDANVYGVTDEELNTYYDKLVMLN